MRRARVTKHEFVQSDECEVMRSIADSSVDAVVTDPPYFKVKDEAWDHAWRNWSCSHE
jgi:site-specific DNA-methyltransferase (adenine-specific)